ncbi:MAG: hypothetical protein K2X50_06605 [Gammaproteobacteria bacterium]|nr:hypothetical protein [Gammaproteobacteria bacterium]
MRTRSIVEFFTRMSSTLEHRNNSVKPHTTLETLIWLPSKKIFDDVTEQVTSREVLSTTEAKRLYAQRVRGVGPLIDPLGHSAGRLLIDCSNPRINEELRERIRELAIINKIVSLKNSLEIKGLECYLSLYPDHDKPLLGKFSELEAEEWRGRTSTDDYILDRGKAALSRNFFRYKYPAFNNNFQADVSNYGKPDFVQQFAGDLDFLKIVEQCFEMMIPVLKNNVIVLETALPSAAYFAKAMLDEHKLITKMISVENTPFLELDKEQELIHVCTTAVLILFKVGMGQDRYYDFVKRVYKDHPELSHGFPITDFCYEFFKSLSLQPSYQNIEISIQEDDLSNLRNKF